MAHISSKIKEYCKANGVNKVDFIKDVELVEDDGVISITQWNLDIPQPTSEQIESYEETANETEANTPTRTDIKASAKTKLMAGEKLTEEEANILVGL
jgi:hypothetical protein